MRIFTLIHQDRRHALLAALMKQFCNEERGFWNSGATIHPENRSLSDFKVELQDEISDDQATKVIQAGGVRGHRCITR